MLPASYPCPYTAAVLPRTQVPESSLPDSILAVFKAVDELAPPPVAYRDSTGLSGVVELPDGARFIPLGRSFRRPTVPVIVGGVRLMLLGVLVGVGLSVALRMASVPWALALIPTLLSLVVAPVAPRLRASAAPQVSHPQSSNASLGVLLREREVVFRHLGAVSHFPASAILDVEVQTVRKGKSVRLGSGETYLYEATQDATLHIAYLEYERERGRISRFHFDQLIQTRRAQEVDLSVEVEEFARFDAVRTEIDRFVRAQRG